MWHQLSCAPPFEVRGKDAVRYLNSRLTRDTRNMQLGESARAAALTAQGRVEGVFTVLCTAPAEFLLICDGGSEVDLLTVLKRYIVADRVTIEPQIKPSCIIHLANTNTQPILEGLKQLVHLVEMPVARCSADGVDLLIEADSQATASEFLKEKLGEGLGELEFAFARFAYGKPQFPSEIIPEMMIAEVGSHDLISFNKGCYVGQEVVERSDAIGKTPRLLERILIEGNAQNILNEVVTLSTGEAIGKIVSVVTGTNVTGSYALLKNGKFTHGSAVTVNSNHGRILRRDEHLEGDRTC